MPKSNHKKILFVILAIIILVCGYLVVSKFFGKNKYTSTAEQNNIVQVPVSDVVGLDSNKNGIADWEETLWGLDPTADGAKNKELINQQKAQKVGDSSSSGTNTSDENSADATNQTEEFSKNLLTTIASLKSSGNLTPENIDTISQTISTKAAESASLPDIYTQISIATTANSTTNLQSYYDAIYATLKKYNGEGIGEETKVMEVGFASENGYELNALPSIAEAYKTMAEEMSKIKVPEGAATYHIAIINDLAKTGTSLENVSKISGDSILGIVGLSQYQKYSANYLADFKNLVNYFTTNGITIKT